MDEPKANLNQDEKARQGLAEANRRIEEARLEKSTRLNLSGLALTTLPVSLGNLTALKTLDLSDNQLTTLPEALGKLTALTLLDLSDNQLTTLPAALGNLTALKWLGLSRNQLTTLPESLGNLTALEFLDLSRNQLTTLPEALGNLTALTTLALSRNQLTTLPEALGNLTALTWLYLDDNQLTTLPEALGKLTTLEGVSLADNPLISEQRAAYDRGGWEELRRFLLDLQEKGESAWLGKLLLVGNGNVGKSCLLDALRGKTPDRNRGTTHGMVREHLHLMADGALVEEENRPKITSPENCIDFHCWDMGGQDAYRPIHQIFFTPEALYILAYHGREDMGRGEVRKWLTLIRNRATSRAKVVLVATHGGQKYSVTPPELAALDEDLRNMIVDFIAVDSFEPHNITELRQLLARRAQENDYFKRRILGGWNRFQEELVKIKNPYQDAQTLVEAIKEPASLSRERTEELLQLSHDCGLLLWHRQNQEIGKYVVLHPDWLSQAIAYVIKDESAQRKHGVVSHADLSELWANPQLKDSKPYPKTVHPMLVALMEENEISYRLPDNSGAKSGQYSLIAQLVAPTPPQAWSTRWEEKAKTQHLEMIRLFSFIPPNDRKPQRLTGLLFRLIVTLHPYSLGREDYQQAVHWQNGLLVQNQIGDLARIELRDDNELDIRVRGLIPVSFMDRLREILQQVVGGFWQGVALRESAMCGSYCPSALKTGAFDVDECLDDLKEGETEKKCTVQACRKRVPLLSLLNPPAEPQGIVELRKILAERFDSVEEKVLKVQSTLEAFDTKMSTFQGLLRDDIRALMTNLMDDGHDGPRLFCVSFLEPGFWDKPKWVSTKLRVTLCCEHSRLPLPLLDKKVGQGVYKIEMPEEWYAKCGPWLLLSGRLILYFKTLGVAGVLPGLTPELEKSITEGAETVQKLAEKLTPEEKGILAPEPGRLPLAVQKESGPEYLQDYGRTLARDSSFAYWLRDKIKAQDKGFAGLIKVRDITGKVLWIHKNYLSEFESPPPRMK